MYGDADRQGHTYPPAIPAAASTCQFCSEQDGPACLQSFSDNQYQYLVLSRPLHNFEKDPTPVADRALHRPPAGHAQATTRWEPSRFRQASLSTDLPNTGKFL